MRQRRILPWILSEEPSERPSSRRESLDGGGKNLVVEVEALWIDVILRGDHRVKLDSPQYEDGGSRTGFLGENLNPN